MNDTTITEACGQLNDLIGEIAYHQALVERLMRKTQSDWLHNNLYRLNLQLEETRTTAAKIRQGL